MPSGFEVAGTIITTTTTAVAGDMATLGFRSVSIEATGVLEFTAMAVSRRVAALDSTMATARESIQAVSIEVAGTTGGVDTDRIPLLLPL